MADRSPVETNATPLIDVAEEVVDVPFDAAVDVANPLVLDESPEAVGMEESPDPNEDEANVDEARPVKPDEEARPDAAVPVAVPDAPAAPGVLVPAADFVAFFEVVVLDSFFACDDARLTIRCESAATTEVNAKMATRTNTRAVEKRIGMIISKECVVVWKRNVRSDGGVRNQSTRRKEGSLLILMGHFFHLLI